MGSGLTQRMLTLGSLYAREEGRAGRRSRSFWAVTQKPPLLSQLQPHQAASISPSSSRLGFGPTRLWESGGWAWWSSGPSCPSLSACPCLCLCVRCCGGSSGPWALLRGTSMGGAGVGPWDVPLKTWGPLSSSQMAPRSQGGGLHRSPQGDRDDRGGQASWSSGCKGRGRMVVNAEDGPLANALSGGSASHPDATIFHPPAFPPSFQDCGAFWWGYGLGGWDDSEKQDPAWHPQLCPWTEK